MKCSRVRELLSEYMDGMLDAGSGEELSAHLSHCKECRAELRSLQACSSALGSLDRPQAPPLFLERVHERIARTEHSPNPAGLIERLLLPLHVKLPLGFAGALAALLLLIVSRHIHKSDQQRTELLFPQSQPALSSISPSPLAEPPAPLARLESAPTTMEKPIVKVPVEIESSAPLPEPGPASGGASKTEMSEQPHEPILLTLLLPAPPVARPQRMRAAPSLPAGKAEGIVSRPSPAPTMRSGAEALKSGGRHSERLSETMDTIRELVTSRGGTVEPAPNMDEAHFPLTLSIKVPLRELPRLVEDLRRIGQIETPPILDTKSDRDGPAQVRLFIRRIE